MKFQSKLKTTKNVTNTDQADSGKKEFSVMKRFRSRVFSGLMISATKGIPFCMCPRFFFTKRFPRNEVEWNGGECAEGWFKS